jgi:hypothetical protein
MASMPRYVILHHEMPSDSARLTHWDFMLEADGVLQTWALEKPLSMDQTVAAEQLADHRIDYLQYEGLVSNNRGEVTRWDAGDYTIVDRSNEQLVVSLTGHRCAGIVTLSRDADDPQRFSVSLRKS